MRFLLDTDICIYVINERPASVLTHFRRHRVGEIGVTAITVAELAYGVEKSGSARNRVALERFLLPLEIVDFDNDAAFAYGRLRAELELEGSPIGPLDMLIAAQALARGSTLVSNNEREFRRVSGLPVENWAAGAR